MFNSALTPKIKKRLMLNDDDDIGELEIAILSQQGVIVCYGEIPPMQEVILKEYLGMDNGQKLSEDNCVELENVGVLIRA